MKILSPVGNFESLKMAVFNGADEVYLGINNFNARNNIDGFNLEDVKSVVDFAHIYNVKVLLAVNILFSDDELQSAFDTVISAYNAGVDAFIIQDLGLAYLLNKHYPQIELHASTQMAIHNLEGVKEILKYGFKRVVLARETPLEEVKRIKQNCDIEIEYFCQGALCVCFSGNCYLSSYLYGASGNRGKCKQLCRLPFTLVKNNKVLKNGYLLSAKDFNMTDKLEDLKNAGVDVIKIEGRARRPFYVAMATKHYYNLLNNKKTNFDNLKLAFNRGFTSGYLDGNGKIISDYQNHIGVFVGKVLKVNYGKKFNEVYFSSNRVLSAKSVFKIFSDGKERNTISAYDLKLVGKEKYKLTTTQKVKIGDGVNLIVDNDLEQKTLSQIKRKKLSASIYAETQKPIKITCSIDGQQIVLQGEVCQSALNQPLTIQDFETNFDKSEMFDCKIAVEKLDNVFMPKQQLNQFRRDFFDLVYKTISEKHYHNLPLIKIKTGFEVDKFDDFQIIENINEHFYKTNIIYSPSEYEVEDIQKFINICNSKNKIPYLDLPNFALERDIVLLKDIIDKTKISIVANNYYALSFNVNIVIGGGLNVYNSVTCKVLNNPVITAESEIANKISYPYMTLRHCPFKNHLHANCNKCPYSEGYKYIMENGKEFNLKRKKLSTCTFYLTD